MKSQKTNFIHEKWQEGNTKKICNPVQNVLRKIKNSSKVRQNQKTFMSIVAYFLSTSAIISSTFAVNENYT